MATLLEKIPRAKMKTNLIQDQIGLYRPEKTNNGNDHKQISNITKHPINVST